MSVHLSLSGKWVECHATERACPRIFHLQQVTVAEAAVMPQDVLLPLLNAIDPPNYVDERGESHWLDDGSLDHRDHDLPAVVHEDGTTEWWQHGLPHREGDKPALVSGVSQRREWWVGGVRHREDGPALLDSDGAPSWWWRGHQFSEESHKRQVAQARGKQA